jgi:hypothetical protein
MVEPPKGDVVAEFVGVVVGLFVGLLVGFGVHAEVAAGWIAVTGSRLD